MARLLALLLFQIALGASANPAAPQFLSSAEVADVDAVELPDTGWQFIAMPHLTPTDNPEPRSIWFRFNVDEFQPNIDGSEKPVGLYLWRYSMNVKAWLNDEYVGGAGAFEDPITRNWNWPQLYVLPKSAWRDQGNEVILQLAVYPGWGHLAPPLIGDYEVLHQSYERRLFRQVHTNQITAYLSLFAALIAITFYLIDRKESAYGIFGLLALSWTLHSFSNFVQYSPVSAKVWWWAVHVNLDVFATLMALFARRLAGVRVGKIEGLLAAYVVISAIVFALLPLVKIGEWNGRIHIAAVLVTVATMLFALFHGMKHGRVEMIALAACIAVIALFAVHDIWMQLAVDYSVWVEGFFILQFAVPILMVTMLVVLSRKFAYSLIARVNAEQEVRLARERIFADIHDDVGSKLLSLIYAAETDAQAELARDALRETRAVITGAVAAEEDLLSVLQNAETEAQQRCEQAGVILNWVAEDVGFNRTSDEFRYNLQRILRELVSNAIKHGQPDQVDVEVSCKEHSFMLLVRDDGRGSDVNEFISGTGISGIQRRCRELRGQVVWESANPGCRVRVHFPFDVLEGAVT